MIDGTWDGTLTVTSSLTISGNFTLASGTLNGNGTISAAGSASQWSGGQINFGTGSLSNSGTLTIATPGSPNSPLLLAGTLTNTGTIIVTGSNSVLANANGTTINNQTGATFNFQGSTGLNSNGKTSTSFNNAGTLEQTAGGGTATISFPVTDSGKIESDSGTLEFTGGGSGSPGVVNAGTGAAVILAGTYSGTFTGSGRALSIFRASRDRRRRSTSPAAPCNGHKRRTDEIWPGPSRTRAR